MRRTRRELELDRGTVALAVLAAVVVAGVAATEGARLLRRRAKDEETEGALDTARAATGDAVAVAREGYVETPEHEAALLHMLTGFVGAFAYARMHTYGVRRGWWPFDDVYLGGRHIHHFVPGILLAFGSGAIALATANERIEPFLAWPFGFGLGLTLDETALLLELQDVYWTREGILSIQVSCATAAALGAAVLSARLIRRGERQASLQGLIPAAP